ncbi:MAG: hypothetical protein ACPGVX_00365 [Thalassobaculaceae bacterium]
MGDDSGDDVKPSDSGQTSSNFGPIIQVVKFFENGEKRKFQILVQCKNGRLGVYTGTSYEPEELTRDPITGWIQVPADK